MQQDASLSPEVLGKALDSLTTLWVKVTKFEAQEQMGVSDIKRDTATGGGIYCLRRNAVGYGLYQDDTEPLTGGYAAGMSGGSLIIFLHFALSCIVPGSKDFNKMYSVIE